MKNTIIRYVPIVGSCDKTDRPSQEQADYFKFSVCFSLITIFSQFFYECVYHKKSHSVKKNRSIRALFTQHKFNFFLVSQYSTRIQIMKCRFNDNFR